MKAIAFLAMLLAFTEAPSQSWEEPDLQRLPDELFGFPGENADFENAYENLVQVLASPFDLNKVSEEELELLHILSDAQIESFIAYRREHGELLALYELQAVPGFDLATIAQLKPFVKITPPAARVNTSLIRRIFSPGNSYVVSRYARTLETVKGFSGPGYSGSPGNVYLRYRSSRPGDFSIGITGEKDSGEKFRFDLPGRQWGFDFTSFHFQIQNKGKLKNLIVGDFQPQFAQGLLLGGAFGLGKGGETVLSVRKSNVGFLPYTSLNESAFQRGACLTFQALKNIFVSAFYSRTKRDAVISDGAHPAVTSFSSTGYHRSMTELEGRKKVTEVNSAVVVEWKKNKLNSGVILNAIHFDLPVVKKPVLDEAFAFGGKQNFNPGIFLNYRSRNVSFFAEASQSLHAGRGLVFGWLITPVKGLDLAVTYRNYAPDFYTFYSNAFSESTDPQNERGIYWGWKYRWSRAFNVTGYADLFTFPWLSFRRYAPSHGYEWLLRANYLPSREISLFIQLREEQKPRNISGGTALYKTADALKRNVSFSCDYRAGKKIRLKSRIQYSRYFFDKKSSRGLTVLQDISFAAGPFRFTARHALFDTDDFDNRQYVYENDAWMAFSFPFYSGRGVRNYALIELKASKRLTFWARYARTRLSGETEIGSGQNLIEGNSRNDVKFQARFRF